MNQTAHACSPKHNQPARLRNPHTAILERQRHAEDWQAAVCCVWFNPYPDDQAANSEEVAMEPIGKVIAKGLAQLVEQAQSAQKAAEKQKPKTGKGLKASVSGKAVRKSFAGRTSSMPR